MTITLSPVSKASRYAAPVPARASRFARVLEQSPGLLERLEDCSGAELGLRDEAALARTLLDEILASFAELHSAKNGDIPASAFGALIGQLKVVQSIVRDAADIEAKRDDQKLSATHVLMLVASLRDTLRAAMLQTFGERAASVVDDVFGNAKWTGDLRDDVLAEALAAPAAYTVSFRKLERDDSGTVREGAVVPNPGAPQSWDATPPVMPCNTATPVAEANGAGDVIGPSPTTSQDTPQNQPKRATIPASASGGGGRVSVPPISEDEIATSKPLDALTLRAKNLRTQLDKLNAARERERAERAAKLNSV